jgi:ribosomal protein L11 methyltransferase
VTSEYFALRFDTAGVEADRWADALFERGALSVDAADPHAGSAGESPLYGEPDTLPTAQHTELWPLTRISALFPAAVDATAVLVAAGAALGEPVPPFTVHGVPDLDWVRLTQAQFAPIRIGERLWIVPSWCEVVDPTAINLRLDPGLAFGTGSHPTTRLCLQWLCENLRPGATVLDYGCGSGILAIAAARLGAATVSGVDIDERAIATSRANAAMNGVAIEFGPPDTPLAAVDVLIANILAGPLRVLAPLLASRVRPGGRIVLSGLLEPQADIVAADYERWFNIDVCGREDGWLALAGMRRAS